MNVAIKAALRLPHPLTPEAPMSLLHPKNPYLSQRAVKVAALIVAAAATAIPFLPPGPYQQAASYLVAFGSVLGIVSPGAVRK